MNPARPDGQVIARLLDYTHEHLGFRLSETSRAKMEAKLRNLILPSPWADLEAFHQALIAGDTAAGELLVKTLTVNHTYFFREPVQIEGMLNGIRANKIAQPLIWSAASSTGEEAYSIVIHLLEQGITRFRLVASDVNPKVLHHMNRGVYHEHHLGGLTKYHLTKYFIRQDENHWKIKPDLRDLVTIKKVNLITPVRFPEPFDFIFCRNVFIYFDDFSRNKVLENLRENLKVGGLLYVGLTEALLDVPPGFHMATHSAYRRTAHG